MHSVTLDEQRICSILNECIDRCFAETQSKIWGILVTKEELKQIGEYAKKDIFDAEETEDLVLLLLKWMYEQGMLQ